LSRSCVIGYRNSFLLTAELNLEWSTSQGVGKDQKLPLGPVSLKRVDHEKEAGTMPRVNNPLP